MSPILCKRKFTRKKIPLPSLPVCWKLFEWLDLRPVLGVESGPLSMSGVEHTNS